MNESYTIIEKLTTVYKIIFLGTSGVGKTTAIKGLYNDSINYPIYPITPNKTQFIDFSTIQLTESKVLQIWDVTDQTNYINALLDYKTLYTHASIIILMFAVNDLHSLMKLIDYHRYLDSILSNEITNGIPILLVGNKIDKQFEVTNTKIKQILYNYPQIKLYLPISSITKEGIKLLRKFIIKFLKDEFATTSLKFNKKILFNLDYQSLKKKENIGLINYNLFLNKGNLEIK